MPAVRSRSFFKHTTVLLSADYFFYVSTEYVFNSLGLCVIYFGKPGRCWLRAMGASPKSVSSTAACTVVPAVPSLLSACRQRPYQTPDQAQQADIPLSVKPTRFTTSNECVCKWATGIFETLSRKQKLNLDSFSCHDEEKKTRPNFWGQKAMCAPGSVNDSQSQEPGSELGTSKSNWMTILK